jgi:flagellar hook-length control protein FliK
MPIVVPFAPSMPIATTDPVPAAPETGAERPATSAASAISAISATSEATARIGRADDMPIAGDVPPPTAVAARPNATPEPHGPVPGSPTSTDSRPKPTPAMPDRRIPAPSAATATLTGGNAPEARVDRSTAAAILPDRGPASAQVQPAAAVPIATDVHPIQADSPARDVGRPAPEPAVLQRADPAPAARTDVAQPAARPTTAAPVAAGPVAVQTAGMVFGFALAPFDPRQQADSRDRDAPRAEALQALGTAAGSAQAVGAVGPAGDARHGALDMRRDDWPQAMIDRIEALRDAADATSTRIRLVPDALGKVDVSLRHDGDAVHVHFSADAAATRALIADAQPRLAEAAQARGLRLGQATVDAGGGDTGRQQQQQPAAAPPLPVRPAPARASAAAADDDGALPELSRLA